MELWLRLIIAVPFFVGVMVLTVSKFNRTQDLIRRGTFNPSEWQYPFTTRDVVTIAAMVVWGFVVWLSGLWAASGS